MAVGYQKHILIGNLGADPRVNQTRNGNLVTNFDIAVNERNRDGTVVVTWYGITAWNGLGEACAEYLKKGRGGQACPSSSNGGRGAHGSDRMGGA